MKRTFHKGQILTLQIQDMAFGGKGIARLETEKGPFVVFVQNASQAKPSKPSREVQVQARRMSLVEGARKGGL